MATTRWKPKAIYTAKVGTVQITAGDASTTYKISINGKAVATYTGSATVATIAAGLVTAWNASTEPEAAEITASSATDTVTLTHDTAGTEFTVSPSVTGGTGTIGSFTVTTSASGPNDASLAANWTEGSAPGGSDVLYIDNNDFALKYNLDQSGAGTQTSLRVDMSMTGDIGLPELNQDATSYKEYRDQYYKIRASSVILGRGPGQGAGRWKIDNDSIQTAVVIENSGTSTDTDIPAILWKGTHASNTMSVTGNASVGVAHFLDEVATIATLTVDGNANVVCGVGTTLTTVNVYGNGTLTINGAVGGQITALGNAVVIINGAGAVTGPIVARDNARIIYNSTGALGGATVLDGSSVLDFDQDPRTKTVSSAIDVRGTPRAAVIDNMKVCGTGLIIDWNGIPGDVSQLGADVRYTRAATA